MSICITRLEELGAVGGPATGINEPGDLPKTKWYPSQEKDVHSVYSGETSKVLPGQAFEIRPFFMLVLVSTCLCLCPLLTIVLCACALTNLPSRASFRLLLPPPVPPVLY